MVLQYASDDISEIYTVIIRMFPGSKLIEFEVKLHGIPVSDNVGREVVANWQVVAFDQAKTFYTDSNGLEMQKRILDYRPDWELTTDEKESSNYYPIQQAIAIRDTNSNMQMTVMNDRSQGGSALEAGSIELMQDRRLLLDDHRGVGEALNETNASGEGIQVNAKYYVQIFDRTKTASVQREQQLIIDEPVMAFYHKGDDSTPLGPAAEPGEFTSDLLSSVDNLKVHLFPEARNQILIRLENMSDLFDGSAESTQYFDLDAYAEELYSRANRGTKPGSVTIVERTLSNNQAMADMLVEKFHWKTVDPASKVTYPDDTSDGYALQPQRIRLFRVFYDTQQPSTFL